MNPQPLANSTSSFRRANGIDELPSDNATSPQTSIIRIQHDITASFVHSTSSERPISIVPSLQMIAPKPYMQPSSLSDEDILADLPPLARWQWLAKHNKLEFAFYFIGLFVAVGTIILSVSHLAPLILEALSWNAIAQETRTPTTTSDDNFVWAILALLAITLIWGLCMVSFSNKTTIVKFAGEMVKTIVGFIVGFLSGRATR